MKRFWLFVWQAWEEAGGMHDFQESFDTLEQAKEKTKRYDDDYCWHVVDSETGKIVSED